MAVTAIWDIKGRFDRVIDYAMNPEKTIEKNPQAVADFHAVDNVLEYAANEMKTEECKFVTGIRCDPECAKEQFKETKIHHGKTGGIVAFHGYQSFAADEVDADTAHKIGVKLAENLWGDKFEVVVATHCNTGHYHNHFVINSVSIVDGHKFNDCKDTYQMIRDESDRLCKEYGLSVIRNPKDKSKNYSEWKAEQEGRPTLRGTIREAIDVAVRGSQNKAELFDALDQMGYIVDLSGKYPKIKHLGNERFVRFESLGPGYSLDEIIRRVYDNLDPEYPDIPPQESSKKIFKNEDGTVSTYGYISVYRSYYAALLITKERPKTNRKMYFLVREDHNHIASYSEQVTMLCEHNINTGEELEAYRNEALKSIDENIALRKDARNDLKRAERVGDTVAVSQIKYNIDQYTRRLNKLRREVSACDQVKERSEQVRDKLQIIESEKFRGKEGIQNEHIRRSSRPDREDEPKRN